MATIFRRALNFARPNTAHIVHGRIGMSVKKVTCILIELIVAFDFCFESRCALLCFNGAIGAAGIFERSSRILFDPVHKCDVEFEVLSQC